MGMTKRSSRNKRWSSKKKLTVIISSIIGVILLCILGFVGYGYFIYSKMDTVDINRDEVLNDEGKKDEYKDVINIALFGVDRGENDGGEDGLKGLGDTNIILTINKDDKEIKLSSIMRDTYVNIPNYGDSIINQAMYEGGPQLMLKTINTNFDLDIDKFIAVNLNTLPQLIDKLGGLDIEVDSDEFKYINLYIDNINIKNNTNVAHLKSSGKQHLNGTQATAYCRIRYTEGTDFKRTERQRNVLTLIAKKLSSMSIGELNSLVIEELPVVKTNLSYGEIVEIGNAILSIGTDKIEQNRFPNDGDHWSSGTSGSYRLNIDKEATIEKMHEFIYK